MIVCMSAMIPGFAAFFAGPGKVVISMLQDAVSYTHLTLPTN